MFYRHVGAFLTACLLSSIDLSAVGPEEKEEPTVFSVTLLSQGVAEEAPPALSSLSSSSLSLTSPNASSASSSFAPSHFREATLEDVLRLSFYTRLDVCWGEGKEESIRLMPGDERLPFNSDEMLLSCRSVCVGDQEIMTFKRPAHQDGLSVDAADLVGLISSDMGLCDFYAYCAKKAGLNASQSSVFKVSLHLYSSISSSDTIQIPGVTTLSINLGPGDHWEQEAPKRFLQSVMFPDLCDFSYSLEDLEKGTCLRFTEGLLSVDKPSGSVIDPSSSDNFLMFKIKSGAFTWFSLLSPGLATDLQKGIAVKQERPDEEGAALWWSRKKGKQSSFLCRTFCNMAILRSNK